MALHNELEIYRSCYTLLGAAGEVIMQMRRDAKKVFGEMIINGCVEPDLHIRAANMAQDKEPHLLRLLERLEVIELLLRTCRDNRYIAVSHFARLVMLTQSIGKQANGWRRMGRGEQVQQQRLFPGG